MSQSPHVLRDVRFGTGLQSPQMDDMLWATLSDEYIGCGMGLTAETLAEKYELTRDDQDSLAVQSHQKSAKAQLTGRFQQEISRSRYSQKKERK